MEESPGSGNVLQNLQNKLQEISKNKDALAKHITQLEILLEKLSTMLQEMLEEQVPPTIKFSYRRISNIDLLTNSISRLGELVRKLRENMHVISGDEIKLGLDLLSLIEETPEQNIDVREIWRQITKLEKSIDVSTITSSTTDKTTIG